MWDGSLRIVDPFDTGCLGGIFGFAIRSDEGIEQDIDGKGLGRVGESRGCEVVGQEIDVESEQIMMPAFQLVVQKGVRMRVVPVVPGNVSMEYVGQNQSRGSISCKGLQLSAPIMMKRRVGCKPGLGGLE